MPDINSWTGLASSVVSTLSHIWKDWRLSLTTKTRIYQALVLSVLLYVAETWPLLNVNSRALKAFHTKCQRRLLQIKWHQFIQNNEITESTNLPSISEPISHRHNSLFDHITRLLEDVPDHKTLKCHTDLSLRHPPSSQWNCRPGRPGNRWVDPIPRDNNLSPTDLWSMPSIMVTTGLQPLLAKR